MHVIVAFHAISFVKQAQVILSKPNLREEKKSLFLFSHDNVY